MRVPNNYAVQFDGIALMCDGTFTGVDQDHCLERGELEPWAAQNVERLNSLTYVTPSGEGVRTLAWGTVNPEGRKKVGHLEIYSQARMFTWREELLPGSPTTIEARQKEIDAIQGSMSPPVVQKASAAAIRTFSGESLGDDAILEKARKSGSGAKFIKLFDQGDASDYQRQNGSTDLSAADMALCRMLAYWTDNCASTMDRLFRRSELMRVERWDGPARSGETYGAGTIRLAIEWQKARAS